MASTAIQCAALSGNPKRASTPRTASANGPPPGTTTTRRDRAASATAARTASKTAALARRPPPTLTTQSTWLASSAEDTPNYTLRPYRPPPILPRNDANPEDVDEGRHAIAGTHRPALLPADRAAGGAARRPERAGCRLHHRRRAGRARSRGRRLGDRRDQRPPDELHQDRRHRRSGALPPSRSASGELSRVGARLRPRRLDAGAGEAVRQRAHAESDAGEDSAGSGQGVSGQLLAVAPRAACEI